MKKIGSSILAITVIIAVAVVACNSNSKTAADAVQEYLPIKEDSFIKRGAYLVTVMGCNDCHTPKKMGPAGPEMDEDRLLSGHPSNMPLGKINREELKSWVLFNPTQTAAVGPWGVSFAANITADESGIGKWSEEQFFTALREGKYKGLKQGRNLLPPMPWPMYAHATDEDLRAIFLYLKTTKPVKNVVPAPIPPDRIGGK
jgi:hypothetical protein